MDIINVNKLPIPKRGEQNKETYRASGIGEYIAVNHKSFLEDTKTHPFYHYFRHLSDNRITYKR
jgi:hypothetical protein